MLTNFFKAIAAAVLVSAPVMAADAPNAQDFQTPQTANVQGGQLQFQTRQGRSLQCDIPAGWSFSDSNNGVDSMAPDGITFMSKTFLRGIGRCTPDLLMQRASRGWANLGITNVQVVSSQNVSPTSKLYEMNYVFRNRPAHAMVQATVSYGPAGGYLANLVSLQSAPETFQQALPIMIAMAKSVRVTDADQFADAGKLNRLAEKRIQIATDSARDIGNIYIEGEKARSKVRDESNKGASDTLRSENRFNDADGNQYTVPLQATRAFKYADGSVTYTSDNTAPVPQGATEMNRYDYTGR